jgi:hypothetical protein
MQVKQPAKMPVIVAAKMRCRHDHGCDDAGGHVLSGPPGETRNLSLQEILRVEG